MIEHEPTRDNLSQEEAIALLAEMQADVDRTREEAKLTPPHQRAIYLREILLSDQ